MPDHRVVYYEVAAQLLPLFVIALVVELRLLGDTHDSHESDSRGGPPFGRLIVALIPVMLLLFIAGEALILETLYKGKVRYITNILLVFALSLGSLGVTLLPVAKASVVIDELFGARVGTWLLRAWIALHGIAVTAAFVMVTLALPPQSEL